MIDALRTRAELEAEKAEALPAFSGLKLLHVKRQVAELLGLIGRNGIFDEYTRHDISHIDSMLEILDWLIPDKTKTIMSPADWLLVVLAVYFHDVGMLVTRNEWEVRVSSGFLDYRDTVLFEGDQGKDYKAKVGVLSSPEAERFIYQEFVRHKHAERIRNWIMGQAPERLGTTHRAMLEVDNLLRSLSAQFRRDLGMVCESHHLDDLNDFEKYKVSQPYGNSEAETANLHYAAVLLRAADLLHMTANRTPSIAFRLINPADPLSQQEWTKQMAVTRVRSKFGRDREGNPDKAAPRDTIEVHAYFTDENGFFGLTSYLQYVSRQLAKCHDWVDRAKLLKSAAHEFPWRYIDDQPVETEGFLRETFEFTIDQPKILDLLTGHTLYNDTAVVLRELVQNSIDAIRLQCYQDKQANPNARPGKLSIHWDTRSRTLSILDNGTGMTQKIIENHLLKVGASRYQDPEFVREFPGFSPISRFGIGVLSTFMVADQVEIVTCHPEDERARQLSLRSVHGRYLIRLLDKHSNEDAKCIGPHGTLVRLKVRPSAELTDIVETAQRWIVIPECEVTVSIDAREPIPVGFRSPKEALETSLRILDITGDGDRDSQSTGRKRIEIREKQVGAVTLAYAVQWSDYFREWSFLRLSRTNVTQLERHLLLGTCIEGIRVEKQAPGFLGFQIAALANTKGPNSPKTNVVRSGLELTAERSQTLRAIYSIYCDHVRSEMSALHTNRSFSLTWSTQEGGYLIEPFLAQDADNRVAEQGVFHEVARTLPLLLVERGGRRESISPLELSREECFWTIDSAFFRSAESLIREVSGPASLSDLVAALRARESHLPNELVLCGFGARNELQISALEGKEVDRIEVHKEQRRVDFRWSGRSDPPRWKKIPSGGVVGHLIRMLGEEHRPTYMRWADLTLTTTPARLAIAQHGVQVTGLTDEYAVAGFGILYILPHSPAGRFMLPLIEKSEHAKGVDSDAISLIILSALTLRFARDSLHNADVQASDVATLVRRAASAIAEEAPHLDHDIQETNLSSLYEVIRNNNWNFFDPSAWARHV